MLPLCPRRDRVCVNLSLQIDRHEGNALPTRSIDYRCGKGDLVVTHRALVGLPVPWISSLILQDRYFTVRANINFFVGVGKEDG